VQFEDLHLLSFQIIFFKKKKKRNSQTIQFLRFSLKSHFLSTKSQFQKHPEAFARPLPFLFSHKLIIVEIVLYVNFQEARWVFVRKIHILL
jgi:hypothetical protein